MSRVDFTGSTAIATCARGGLGESLLPENGTLTDTGEEARFLLLGTELADERSHEVHARLVLDRYSDSSLVECVGVVSAGGGHALLENRIL